MIKWDLARWLLEDSLSRDIGILRHPRGFGESLEESENFLSLHVCVSQVLFWNESPWLSSDSPRAFTIC